MAEIGETVHGKFCNWDGMDARLLYLGRLEALNECEIEHLCLYFSVLFSLSVLV